MKVETFIAMLEVYKGREIFYQDAEGAFPPSEPTLLEVFDGSITIEGNGHEG